MKKTFKFDFGKNEFVLENGAVQTVSGVNALKLWIDKILHTPYARYKIYSGTRYGTGIEDLTVGKSYGAAFTESELKREIETALLQNEDIIAIDNIGIVNDGSESLKISVDLKTTYGEVEYTNDA